MVMDECNVQCPLCHSDRALYFDRHNRFEQKLYQCSDCAFYFAWPHVPIIHGEDSSGDIDAVEGYWANEGAMKDYLSWRDAENSRLARWILEAGELGNILEVGVGDGHLAGRIAAAGKSYWGIEPDPQAYGRLQEKFPRLKDNIYRLKSDQLDHDFPYANKDGYFDTICMMSVLEHISAPRDFFKSSRRLLKRGGQLLISVPNSRSFWLFYILRRLMRIEPWAYFHISFFTNRNLTRALEAEGFSIHTIRTHTLLSPDSISYFQKRFKSPVLGWGMRVFKLFGLDSLTGMNTLFIVAVKGQSGPVDNQDSHGEA